MAFFSLKNENANGVGAAVSRLFGQPPKVVHPFNAPLTMTEPKGSTNFAPPEHFHDYKLRDTKIEPVNVGGVMRPTMLAVLVRTTRPSGLLVEMDVAASVADMKKSGHPQTDQAAKLLSNTYDNRVAPENKERPLQAWTPVNNAATDKGVGIGAPRTNAAMTAGAPT